MKNNNNNIISGNFHELLSERYISYALSTIMSRSLPDVRDGLKPVHRRLLYAMHELKLDPKSGYKKCARVVGDVIGKFHPHGDQAVYDALVRLAQDFSLRYPLIDGQGNFGSVDGDNAAAMRYTESRLTNVAVYMLQDLEADTVNFRPTYDGTEEEPEVLPSNFPNLLANGSEGIAVGMATSIPPHNVDEICEALIKIIENPEITNEELVEFIPGPDFPTGGIIVEPKDNIAKIYETGKGGIRIRARWHKQDLSHGLYQIVINEIPYQVQKSRLIEKLADLLKDKKLPLLSNIRDESAEDIRIIIEPRNKSVDPEMLMESLFKLTDLESRYSFNMNVLGDNLIPEVMGLKKILVHFIKHREEVITRRSKFRLNKVDARLHILEGLLICYLNIDEVIAIIRESDEAKQELMRKFSLSDVQAEAILNMRLRSLRKLEEVELQKEQKSLLSEKAKLEKILGNYKELMKVVKHEVNDIKAKFGKDTEYGKRKTDIINKQISTDVVDINAFIEKEPITVTISKMGWIRAIKGHDIKVEELKFKDGDEIGISTECYTTDKLILLSDKGKFYTLAADKLPRGKGYGEPVRISIDLDANDEIVLLKPFVSKEKMLLVSSISKGFIVEEDSVVAQTKNGKQIMDLPKNSKIFKVLKVDQPYVAIIGENRKMLIFPIDQIPVMKKGQGLTLQKYKDGTISDIMLFNIEDGMKWKSRGTKYNVTDFTPWLGNRGGSGRMAPTGFPLTNKFTLINEMK